MAARFHHEGDAIWFVTDAIGFNMVVSTPITADTPERATDEILKDIAAFSEGSTTWNIDPSLLNPILEDRLCVNGWSTSEHVQSMVLDLHTLKSPEEKTADLRIEIVDTAEAFRQFMRVTAASFFPEPIADYWNGLDHGDTFLHDSDCRYYLGYMQDRFFIRDGICGRKKDTILWHL